MCCRRHRVTFQALIPSTPWVERKMGATAIRSDLPSVDYFVRRIKHFCYNLPIIGTIMCVLWCSGFPLQIMYCYRMRRDGNLKFKHWLRGGKKCIVCSRNFISFPAALPLRDHKLIDRLDGMISAGWNSLPDCGITRREFEKRVQEGSSLLCVISGADRKQMGLPTRYAPRWARVIWQGKLKRSGTILKNHKQVNQAEHAPDGWGGPEMELTSSRAASADASLIQGTAARTRERITRDPGGDLRLSPWQGRLSDMM